MLEYPEDARFTARRTNCGSVWTAKISLARVSAAPVVPWPETVAGKEPQLPEHPLRTRNLTVEAAIVLSEFEAVLELLAPEPTSGNVGLGIPLGRSLNLKIIIL